MKPIERLQDLAASVDATVTVGTKQLGDSGHQWPYVVINYRGKTRELHLPTFRQCAQRGQEWLEDVAHG